MASRGPKQNPLLRTRLRPDEVRQDLPHQAIHRNLREGWADDARRLAAQGGDALLWPEVANEGDSKLVW
jgi:hypothetical protein